MSSAGQPPASLRPSVFISYSSDDRVAARALRDTLAAAGLEVWYDENELGGGDAWDQKIRRQIRDCDYFMPVISASTERRKEGYFRREWRLAAERTMDMADDVLFLLPVVIDGTSDAGARVPDKFVTVQWLRTPGGQSTPALEALVKRLLAGEHTAPPRPPLVGRTNPAGSAPPLAPAAPAAPAAPSGPPPMPAFPHHPQGGGHWPKYLAEVLWWIVTAAWLLFIRLPRWVRVILSVWLIFALLGPCRTTTERPARKDSPPAASNSEVKKAIRQVAEESANALRDAGKDGKAPDFARLGTELARRFSKNVVDLHLAGKQLILIPLARDPQNEALTQFGSTAFAAAFGPLLVARPGDAGVAAPLASTSTDDALAEVGRNIGAEFVLGGRMVETAGARVLAVRLIRLSDNAAMWTADYPVEGGDATKAGEAIAAAVLAAVPARK